MSEVNRRRLLLTAAATGAGAVVLEPLVFPPAARADGGTEQTTVTGHIDYGAADWVYVPIQVPAGVNRITVSYSYDRPTPPAGYSGNALDIGVFDERGYDLGNAAGFRGWSGGFRSRFTISASDATPGYLPGPVRRGVWHVIFGPYTVAPQGLNWSLTVELSYGPDGAPFVPRHAPQRATGRGPAWYRGDMHLHTVHSDGRRLPAEVAAGARAAGLDYIVSTDHNTSSAAGVWGEFAGPDLLIIDGEEITTRNGHYTALGLPAGTWIDWRYRAVDGALARFVQQIHRAGGLAVAAHPLAPCVACGWKFGYAGLDAVEVWNGPWTLDDEAVLAGWDNLLVAGAVIPGARQGGADASPGAAGAVIPGARQGGADASPGAGGDWIPAVGNSDAHSEPQVIGLPQNVVFAGDLDRRSILAGVKAGRVWLAESSAVNLSFVAGTAGRQAGVDESAARQAGIGQRLEVGDATPVTVTLTVDGAPGATVRLITDQGVRSTATLPAAGTGTVTWATTPRNSRYVRAEVRRPVPTATTPDTMVALTNPIFLGRSRR